MVLAGVCALAGCGGQAQPRTVLVREGGQWIKVVAAEGTPQGELALIRAHMADKEYLDVVEAAEKFRKKYATDFRREDVAMLAGHARMARGHYIKAHEWYVRQLDEFPAGDLSGQALDREYTIADAFLRGREQAIVWNVFGLGEVDIWHLSAVSEAIKILMDIAGRAPSSDLAEKALLRIGDYYFDGEEYHQAAEAYDEYLLMFRKRPMSPYAQLRAARSVYATYLDARYDSTPLVDADLRFREFRIDYPDRARAEGVEKIIFEIADRRAEADYYVAQLFERIERPKAAIFFYDQAAKRYGQTLWTARAAAAAKRLADLLPKTEPKLPGQP